MAKQALATRTDIDPIDRLEDKIRTLVAVLAQLRAEQDKSSEENARLAREIDSLHVRLSEYEASGTELGILRDERDQIRSRVAEMLHQLESI